MNNSDYFSLRSVVSVLIGLVFGIVLTVFLSDSVETNEAASEEPLYWVAPMDSNYRRDEPGKSPMGMDLVPVYDENSTPEEFGPGTISIGSNMVNNLGVRTALVERKPINEEVLTVGYVKYDETKLVHIHPRVSGWVEELYVKAAGEPVEKNAPLYSLYSPELVSAQEEFVLSLKSKNTSLIAAGEERLNALQVPTNIIEQLKRNKKVNQSITFHALQTGFVDNLNIREGFYVQPGTTLLSIGVLDSVWVEAEVLERQASQISVGAKAVMSLDYLPGSTFHSEVDYIYPVLDSKTRTLRVRLKLDNPKQLLLPNMFAQVAIYTDNQEPTLVIPSEALIRTGQQNRVVLALGEGRFKSVEVEAGREDRTSVEIIRGLNEGDRVVSSAQFLLDSESSKTSDFLGIGQEPDSTAWVAGVVVDQNYEHKSVRVSHEKIDAWDMMAMTMEFRVDIAVDFDALTPETRLHMEIQRMATGGFNIVSTHIISQGQSKTGLSKDATKVDAEIDTEIDTSTMNQSTMDHSTMGHSESKDGSHQMPKADKE